MRAVVRKEYAVASMKEQFPDLEVLTEDADGEILVCEPNLCSREYLEKMPSLRWIQVPRSGYDALDLDYVQRHGIKLTTGRGLYSIPIAEDIICKILMYTNTVLPCLQRQRGHDYRRNTDRFLIQNLTIGFFGTGSIACEAAKRLAPFGCRITGYKRRPVDHLEGFDTLYYGDDFDRFVQDCDVLVLTADLNPSTFHKFDASVFAMMKPSAAIINVSRGPVICEPDLIEALQNHEIAFAGLDVFEQEPLEQDSPLWDMDNVVVTAHSAGTCKENHDAFNQLLVTNVTRYLNGEDLVNQI